MTTTYKLNRSQTLTMFLIRTHTENDVHVFMKGTCTHLQILSFTTQHPVRFQFEMVHYGSFNMVNMKVIDTHSKGRRCLGVVVTVTV